MAKSILKLQARKLRSEGLGIKTIAYQLQVSSSTASLWCRDIRLTPEQITELERRSHDPHYGRRLAHVYKQQQERKEKILTLNLKGIKDIGNLTTKELFAAGVSLYWAEGFKKDSQAGFANSDPSMIKFFIFWLEKCCKIPKQRLKFRLGLNEQYKDQALEIQDYWVQLLEIKADQFQKPYFQKVTWKKIYENPNNYHGVLRIRVSKSTELLRTIHGWIEGLRKQVG